MTSKGRVFAILLLVLLAVLAGCKKKKPNVPPPQAQAPTISEPPAQPQPEPQPQPQPEPQPAPQPEKPVTAPAPKPKPRKRHVTKKTPPPATPAPTPTPAEKGKNPPDSAAGTPAGQLSAGIPEDEATRQRRTTAQLRQNAENSLRNITRQLSTDEQSMVQQIRTYLAQSRSAENDGDIERSYNLALKARLLSDELAKR